MYKKFFGFKEKPFKLVPDPEYFFLGKSHDETLTKILFAISQGKESIKITGELGTGKTTLCKAFIGNLDNSIKTAFISTPKLDALQLLKSINYAFSLDTSPDNTKALIDTLYRFLIEKKDCGQKVLVIIDEAQNLPYEALEQVLLLANLETTRGKMLQIILVGQPGLDDILASDQLKQLGQRITKSSQLAPLTFMETIDYIEHRISHAAHKAGPSFDKASCRAIYEYSKGIPQRINIGCEMALVTAFNRKSSQITGALTRDALKVLTPEKPDRRPNKFPVLAILSAVLVSVIIILLYLAKGPLPESAVIDGFVNKAKVPAASKPIDPAVDKLEIAEMVPPVKQSQPAEKILENMTKFPAALEPIDSAVDNLKIPAMPLALKQSQPAEKIPENSTVYAVHAGSFKTVSQANLLLNNLKTLGFPSFGYTSLSKTGNTVHVVVAGKYPSYDLAKEASRSLSNNGHSNFIIEAKNSLRIPTGSKPIGTVADKPKIPAMPLAVKQSKAAEKISQARTKVPTDSGPIEAVADKPDIPAKPLAVKQSQPAEKILQARAKVPADSGPIETVADKPKIPAMPPAVKQSQPAEKIPEKGDFYAVHAGSFYNESRANLLLNKLKALDFPSFMYSSLSKKGNSVHVVVAGKYPSYDLAKAASRSLSNKGHSNFIARAKESLKISEDSAPLEAVADNAKIPVKPPAIKQSQAAEKIPASSTVYAVHAGSFKTASQANLLVNTLKSLGFPSFMYPGLSKKGNAVHVVVAGKYPSYDLAKAASQSLSNKGHSNFIARAKDSLKIPAGSAPVEAVADNAKIPVKPLAVKQSQAAEKIPASSTVYAVHAGSFKTASQANLLVNTLKSLGFPSFMYPGLSKKGNAVQVVVAGKYPSYDLAKAASQSLSTKGHSNFIARAKDSLKQGPAK